jgi:hypothetical protein
MAVFFPEAFVCGKQADCARTVNIQPQQTQSSS